MQTSVLGKALHSGPKEQVDTGIGKGENYYEFIAKLGHGDSALYIQ